MVVGSPSLEFRGDVWTGDIMLERVITWMVCKATRQGDTATGVNTEKKRRPRGLDSALTLPLGIQLVPVVLDRKTPLRAAKANKEPCEQPRSSCWEAAGCPSAWRPAMVAAHQEAKCSVSPGGGFGLFVTCSGSCRERQLPRPTMCPYYSVQ